jgi:hypothetical protein
LSRELISATNVMSLAEFATVSSFCAYMMMGDKYHKHTPDNMTPTTILAQ